MLDRHFDGKSRLFFAALQVKCAQNCLCFLFQNEILIDKLLKLIQTMGAGNGLESSGHLDVQTFISQVILLITRRNALFRKIAFSY